jgi:hypothetical protein
MQKYSPPLESLQVVVIELPSLVNSAFAMHGVQEVHPEQLLQSTQPSVVYPVVRPELG